MNYDKLKKVIIEANRQQPGDSVEYEMMVRTLRLADVLLAISEQAITSYAISFNGGFFQLRPEEHWVADWNLKDDNLDNQSKETKQFLIDLLV